MTLKVTHSLIREVAQLVDLERLQLVIPRCATIEVGQLVKLRSLLPMQQILRNTHLIIHHRTIEPTPDRRCPIPPGPSLPRGRGWNTRGAPGNRRYLKSFQNMDPTLRCRPDSVHGMPVARETLRFAFVIPTARFQLKPPLFIASPLQCRHGGPSEPYREVGARLAECHGSLGLGHHPGRANVGWRGTLPAVRMSA
jgi:hypothetical protein